MPSPSYLEAYKSGKLQKNVQRLIKKLALCELCPRRCRINRLENEKGFCKTGRKAIVSSFSPHFGEERPLVGHAGSGTIFFTYCNLRCCFCQNYEISHKGLGQEIHSEELAKIMIHLQNQGCHNINLVSPSHVVAQIMEAMPIAIEAGLEIPLVYNTGGYDLPETLKLLEGIVDIYMPDVKFSNKETAQELLTAPDYPEVIQQALLEMHRQAGDLYLDKAGIAQKGLLIRHLVMPSHLSETDELLEWIARHVSKNSYINIMDQYRPCGSIQKHPSLLRGTTTEEFQQALASAQKHGLQRLDQRRPFHILPL